MNKLRVSLLTVLAAALLAIPVLRAMAFPEPSIVRRSWEFEIDFGRPKPVSIRDITGEHRWYWYLTYQIENDTGQERLFIPEITVATDQGDIIVAGQNVPPSVFDVIKERERNPLLLSPIQIVGRVLQGTDFVREGVAIWPAFDKPVDYMDVFFSGVSGETAVIDLPGEEEEKEQVVVRKTLMIKYHMPGSRVHPQQQTIEPLGQEWVMR